MPVGSQLGKSTAKPSSQNQILGMLVSQMQSSNSSQAQQMMQYKQPQMASTHATNLSQMKAPPMQPTILERPLNEEYDPMPNPNKSN